MTEPRWLDEREQHAWRGLITMWTQLNAELGRRLVANSELSMSDFAVLVALTDECRGGRVRAFELANDLQWEKSRLSHHLSRMEKRGLLSRDGCTEDGRGQVVVVTPAGRRAIEAAAPAHVESVRELLFDAMTPDQVDALAAIAEASLARVRAAETPAP
ncbi:MAG TPA: MarR family winged helix-turn-helix transcriptional regulator [Sporichthyaceae bacterium]